MLQLAKNIKNEKIRENTINAINSLPDYFWKIPASSTGKYHPKFSLGEGGLVRHTKFAVEIAIELFNIYNFSDMEKDIIISALILHDGLKKGATEQGHTIKNHDDVMADWLDSFWTEYFDGKVGIIGCVKSHMGKWATTVQPDTVLQKFVHLCDYIASRKIIDKYYK